MVAFRRCLPESGSESELVGVSVAVEWLAAVAGAVVELPVSQRPMRAAARPAGVADMQPVRRRGVLQYVVKGAEILVGFLLSRL